MAMNQPYRPDPYTNKEKTYLSLIGGLIIAFFFTFTAIFATVHSDPKPHQEVAIVLKYFDLESTTSINFTSIIKDPLQLQQAMNDSRLQVLQFNVGTNGNAVVLLDELLNVVNMSFIDTLTTATRKSNTTTPKGIYLRFHEPTDVVPVLNQVVNVPRINNVPVWMGAKVIQGPGGSPSKFDPDWFISNCRAAIPSVYLSLGWTTGANESSLEFTLQQVNDMLHYADRYYMKPNEMVSLEVEIHSIIRSWKWMRGITDDPNHVLLVSASKPLNLDTRNWMYANLNPLRGFYNQLAYEPGVRPFWIY